jgi:hypothetical protein
MRTKLDIYISIYSVAKVLRYQSVIQRPWIECQAVPDIYNILYEM